MPLNTSPRASQSCLFLIRAEFDPGCHRDGAGSQDVHTQAKPCRASHPGPLFASQNLLKSHGMHSVPLFW